MGVGVDPKEYTPRRVHLNFNFPPRPRPHTPTRPIQALGPRFDAVDLFARISTPFPYMAVNIPCIFMLTTAHITDQVVVQSS